MQIGALDQSRDNSGRELRAAGVHAPATGLKGRISHENAMNSVILATALAALAATQPMRGDIDGYWKNPIGSAIIRISTCGKARCGHVVWASERGQREVSKTTRHVVGTTVLTDVRPEDGHWSGRLFVPDDNIHVAARLQLLNPRELKLTGCAFVGLICRSQVWTRADQPIR